MSEKQPADWKQKLLAALADPNVKEHQDPAGCWMFLVSFSKAMCWLGAGAIVFFVVSQQAGKLEGAGTRFVAQLASFLIVFALWLRLGVPRMTKHLMRAMLWKFGGSPRTRISKAKRAPVFYLRSFAFDSRASQIPLWMRLTGFTLSMTREMIMTMHVSPRAPILAIGKPDEAEAPLGAARFYVSHEIWQAKVQEVVPLCSLVLWATGRTQGLQWEMRHLTSNLPPEKLVLLLHVHVGKWTPQERREEWEAFRKDYESIFPKPLPADVEKVMFITFQPDWTPRVIPEPGRRYSLFQRFNNLGMTGFRELLREKLP